MPDVFWDEGARLLVVAADRRYDRLAKRLLVDAPDWVVVVRPVPAENTVYYYAFRPSEVEDLAASWNDPQAVPIGEVLNLHEWGASGTARQQHPLAPPGRGGGPTTERVVRLNASGDVETVGERVYLAMADGGAGEPPDVEGGDLEVGELEVGDLDLGEFRGPEKSAEAGAEPPPSASGEIPSAPPGPEALELTLSAEAPQEVQVGGVVQIPFLLEWSAEAVPLAVSTTATAQPDVPLTVSLSLETEALAVIGAASFTVDPPRAGQPQSGFFRVKGLHAGASQVAVTFRQGGSILGVLTLTVAVVNQEARADQARGAAVAAPRDRAEDDKLLLLIERTHEGGSLYYTYTLHTEKLALPTLKLRSKPLLDSGGGPAQTERAFVERLYQRVTKELKSFEDLKKLDRETRALGVLLCDELFAPDVAAQLWPLRAQLQVIEVVSWEPYIPWELVRLRDPQSGDIDDRFLASYGLVRRPVDVLPPRTLPLADWRYLGAEFPAGSFKPIGDELAFFQGSGPGTLRSHHRTPVPVAATLDDFYDVLQDGDFDVLHIACHGESDHGAIDEARLILGDQTRPGSTTPSLITADVVGVRAEARLKTRQPLVFLNGCETGQLGAVLTSWGGWPTVFLKAGAGVFVGTSWPVRDKPAAAFAQAFYTALLGGEPLFAAANAGRAAAQRLGDASWLAFKVFGHPHARLGSR